MFGACFYYMQINYVYVVRYMHVCCLFLLRANQLCVCCTIYACLVPVFTTCKSIMCMLYDICMFGACFYYVCTSRISNCESVLCIYLLIILPYFVVTWLIFFRNYIQSIVNMEREKERMFIQLFISFERKFNTSRFFVSKIVKIVNYTQKDTHLRYVQIRIIKLSSEHRRR